MSLKPVFPWIALVGPTGIGKTEVALSLAEKLPVEIVVVDSMQVYRGMDLGTGKPSQEIQERIPHHGLDLVEPEEEFHVAKYVRKVSPVLDQIVSREKVSLLVGGSGFYFKALLEGLHEGPGADPELRDRLLQEAATLGAEKLHARLGSVDAAAAQRIHPNDLKRVVRALEVFHLTGQSLSDWHAQNQSAPAQRTEILWVGLNADRAWLYQKIEQRIDAWLASGWVDEAKVLAGKALSLTAQEALGYRELFAYLQGSRSLEEARQLIHLNTRHYAKRQLSWFRQNEQIQWFDVTQATCEEAARAIHRQMTGEVHGTGTSR